MGADGQEAAIDTYMLKTIDAEVLKIRIEAVRYLHEHAYKRIVWYRAEIWRISMPLWAGFGGLLLAAWGTAKVMHQNEVIASLTAVIGVILIWFYSRYLEPLFGATRYCNDVAGRRERTLCKVLGMENVDGFTTDGYINCAHEGIDTGGSGDCDYKVWRLSRPGLQFIFPVVAVIILTAVCLNIWYMPKLSGMSSATSQHMTPIVSDTIRQMK